MQNRVVGRSGLKIGRVVLGTARFGGTHERSIAEDDARALLSAFHDRGGNAIDTASNYQSGESERIVGRWTQGIRNDFVLCTKCSFGAERPGNLLETGNSRRAMRQSVEASLRRMGTDRVDILWVHGPDQVTPVEELARGLDDLVRSGKVLYTGLSNFPAWQAAALHVLSSIQNQAPINGIQFEYSLYERSAEREIIPMARAFDLAMFCWSPLGAGLLSGKYSIPGDHRLSMVMQGLERVAAEQNASPARVALAWLDALRCFPIIGPGSVQALRQLLDEPLTLSPEQQRWLDNASAIDLGYPHCHAPAYFSATGGDSLGSPMGIFSRASLIVRAQK